MAYLELSNINKEFAKAVAVNDFNLSAEQGEFISFLGPSGCGKTTTLRMIAGFELPTSGKIQIDGKDLTLVPPNKRNVGMVFQSYALFPNMTVAGNIGYGLRMIGKPKAEINQRVKELLSLIHMEGFSERYPSQISGGQQQRVALARALAIRPRVLLLDEPLSALDAKIRVELRQEIRRIQQQLGITTIYVTHDQEEALSISDRIVVMSEGKVEQIGSSSEIYNFPKTEFVANFVGQLNLLPVNVVNLADGLVKVGEQVVKTSQSLDHMNGHAIRLAVRPEELNPGHREGENNLLGRVSTVTYLGPVVRVRLEVEGGALTIDMFNERRLQVPLVGNSFEFSFHPDACWLL
ncbi:MAG: ABC transporter ATP-binding protein [Anaerolineales bacterium]